MLFYRFLMYFRSHSGAFLLAHFIKELPKYTDIVFGYQYSTKNINQGEDLSFIL